MIQLQGNRRAPGFASGVMLFLFAAGTGVAEVAALRATSTTMPVVAIRPHLVWGPGDTQLVGRVVDRARRGRLAIVGSGTALVDTTYVDNAASALVAAIDRVDQLGGRALVVSNGEPRTVHELMARILEAAGISRRPAHVPTRIALLGGSVAEKVWARRGRTDDPPMTRFSAEQLSTAHWFDQRETREALHWAPKVSLTEGLATLAEWFRAQEEQARPMH
jgi:nucleoside-diphosphate-sugar epimerase